ncbi:glycosyl transferase family 90-domain-containing protein [Kockovaella imperatae]|uniref:Glycosyl transferase family 90-domain-containing protein n=1 Tax=Kockovaella imperatae TaxID=4999 RepID=A0A1Y1UT84_9TREE|nr:glycosyl transferase family 90-domain-containing protein [Kockovaella imperatae]ORX41228.1 glycosyl transferase family 90-domain-containing protein [Kockovaella imperatae]
MYYYSPAGSSLDLGYTTSVSPTYHHSLVFDGTTGLAKNWTSGEPKHPIEVLMERGQKKWERMLRRQSKSLSEAVQTYRNRYHRDPPKGFEIWYQWARDHNVTFIDDYDQVFRDTHLFYALSPTEFRKRRDESVAESYPSNLHLGPNTPVKVDGGNPNFRGHALGELLQDLRHLLPDEVVLAGSTHDLGSTMMGDDQRQYLETKIAAGEYVDPHDEAFKRLEWNLRHGDRGQTGQASSCPEDSPAWIEDAKRYEREGGPIKGPAPPSFIFDQRMSDDFCYNPDLLKFHGGLSYHYPKGPKMRPMFHQSKYLSAPEFLLTPLDFYKDPADPRNRHLSLSWDEKTENRLQWRGMTTGDFYSVRNGYDWHNSHRIRLHRLTHDKDGDIGIYVKGRRTNTWEWQTWQKEMINKAYMDIGLVDGAHQCDKKDGSCDAINHEIDWMPRMDPEQAVKYKCEIDLFDGNGWSSRFQRLLLSGSVVLKSTIYAEWFSDWLVPWYHYVPVQVSYSELYVILSFFIGAPRTPSTGHDHLAEKIGNHGREFAQNFWRREDMQSYMFRLLLEYIRLGQDDRESWSYTA